MLGRPLNGPEMKLTDTGKLAEPVCMSERPIPIYFFLLGPCFNRTVKLAERMTLNLVLN